MDVQVSNISQCQISEGQVLEGSVWEIPASANRCSTAKAFYQLHPWKECKSENAWQAYDLKYNGSGLIDSLSAIDKKGI